MLIGCGEDLPEPEADMVFGNTHEVVAQLLLHSMLERDQPSQSAHDSFVIGCAGTA